MGGASVVETELAFLCKVPSNCQEALISPLAEFAVSASFEGPIAVFAKAIAACGNCCDRSRSTIAYVFWLRVRISWQRLTSNWALCTQMRGVRTRALSSLAPSFCSWSFSDRKRFAIAAKTTCCLLPKLAVSAFFEGPTAALTGAIAA